MLHREGERDALESAAVEGDSPLREPQPGIAAS